MSAITGQSSSTFSGTDTPGPGQQQPDDYPKASLDAQDFLNSITKDDFKYILFNDDLVTTSDTGKALGEFCVTITPTKHRGEDCFLVHASSHGSIDNVPCGTSITAHVSHTLDTLEQNHHEYVKLENHPMDRKTIIVLEENGYVVNRIITQGEDVQRTNLTFSKDHLQGFVSEGSNLLLQRLMIKKGVPDDCQFISFDSETRLCPVLYCSLDKRAQVVNDTEIDVYGIERTINSLSDLPTTWQSYFTKDGHLTSRVQVGSPVTMRLLRVPTPIEEDEDEGKPTFGKQDLVWEEDMEMQSKFLARKEELKDEHAKYMRQHQELQALMADFLQFMLLRKPDDTIAFAADYFSSFETKIPSTTPYLDSAAPTPFPYSRSNSKIQYLTKKT